MGFRKVLAPCPVATRQHDDRRGERRSDGQLDTHPVRRLALDTGVQPLHRRRERIPAEEVAHRLVRVDHRSAEHP